MPTKHNNIYIPTSERVSDFFGQISLLAHERFAVHLGKTAPSGEVETF